MSETAPHTCFYHPSVETELRCNKCGKYICPKDAVRTPVGYRCRGCVKEQQDIYFTATPIDYVVAAVVTFVLSMIAAVIIPALGFFAIFAAPIAGTVIAEGVLRTSGKRRGRYIWAVAIGCMVVTAAMRIFTLPEMQMALYFRIFDGVAMSLIWMAVYLIIAGGIVIARLRFLKIG